MKRSDMVIQLSNILSSTRVLSPKSAEADFILARLEALGMKPPYRTVRKMAIPETRIMSYSYDYSWEPEDE